MGKHWTTFLYYYPRDVTEAPQLLWIRSCFYSAALYFMSFIYLFLLFCPRFICWRSDCSNNKEIYLFGPGGKILNTYSSLADLNRIGSSWYWVWLNFLEGSSEDLGIMSLSSRADRAAMCLQKMHACRQAETPFNILPATNMYVSNYIQSDKSNRKTWNIIATCLYL